MKKASPSYIIRLFELDDMKEIISMYKGAAGISISKEQFVSCAVFFEVQSFQFHLRGGAILTSAKLARGSGPEARVSDPDRGHA